VSAPIEFFFDFSSPYGYLASTRIEVIAAKYDRQVDWKPILLGAVFKVSGAGPLTEVPLKGPYSRHDMARFTRLMQVPFAWPVVFPFSTIAACRAFYFVQETDPAAAVTLAKALYRAGLGEGGDIAAPEAVIVIARTIGLDADKLAAGIQDPRIKQRLKEITDDAISREIFGSPFIIVDGEPFWGADRLDQVDRWLATGGW